MWFATMRTPCTGNSARASGSSNTRRNFTRRRSERRSSFCIASARSNSRDPQLTPDEMEIMDACCTDKACAIGLLRKRQTVTLRAVLIVNAVMFGVEFVSGLLVGSVALLAYSPDILGDAFIYGFSLYVVARDGVWKARAAVAKAAVMGLFGTFVLAQVIYKLVVPQTPTFEAMGAVGGLALIA